jgi:hypothetical protein
MKRSTASTACSFGLAISAKHGTSFNGGLMDDRLVRRDAHSGAPLWISRDNQRGDFRRRQTGRPLTSPWRRANAFPDSIAVTFHLSSSHIGILIWFSRKRSLTALQWRWHRIACSQQRSYAHLRWICSDADSQPNKIFQPIPKDISRCRELVRCTSRNPGEPLPISYESRIH